MKIGSRITLLFIFPIILISLIITIVYYYNIQNEALSSQQSKLKYFAQTLAEILDSANLYQLNDNSPLQPGYKLTWNKLQKIYKDSGTAYLYIMKTNQEGKFVFAYDAADDPEVIVLTNSSGKKIFQYVSNVSKTRLNILPIQDGADTYGTVYQKAPSEAYEVLRSGKPVYTKNQNKFGSLISIFSPVTNQNGSVIAIIGSGYDIKIITKEIIVVLALIILGLLLSLLVRFILDRTLIHSIEEISSFAVEIAAGKLDSRIRLDTRDEIGKLSKSLNSMADRLRDSLLETEKKNAELRRELFFDNLTGLMNRQQLMSDLLTTKNPVLMLVNVDSFQEINDVYGTEAGDSILRNISERLNKIRLTEDYRLYKMHSDEFCILIDADMIQQEMEVLGIYYSEGLMEKPFFYKDNEIYLTISIGIGYPFTEDAGNKIENWRSALMHSDMALKKAKITRKKFMVFDESLGIKKEYESNIIWIKKVKTALQEGKIVPYFQPIINNLNRKVEKFECLVRLVDQDGSIISPYQFLKPARKARLYHYITKNMVEKSFKAFADNDYGFSINLSVEDMLDEKTASFILSQMSANPEISKRVVFEILESEDIENYQDVRSFIEEVKKMGGKLAIDDFGSGYSNFSHVIHLNIDYLKIDSSIIRHIDEDRNAEVITRTISSFAHELGIKTIGEFVHSDSVFRKTRELGLDYSQGFFFGEPVSTINSSINK